MFATSSFDVVNGEKFHRCFAAAGADTSVSGDCLQSQRLATQFRASANLLSILCLPLPLSLSAKCKTFWRAVFRTFLTTVFQKGFVGNGVFLEIAQLGAFPVKNRLTIASVAITPLGFQSFLVSLIELAGIFGRSFHACLLLHDSTAGGYTTKCRLLIDTDG